MKLSKQEEELVDLGKERYLTNLKTVTNQNLYSKSSLGTIIVSNSMEAVSTQITKSLDYFVPKINTYNLSPELLTFIGLSVLFDNLPLIDSFASIAIRIGTAIENEVNANKTEGIKVTKANIRSIKIQDRLILPKKQKIRLGTLLLHAIERATNLIEFVKSYKRKRAKRIIQPTEELEAFVNAFIRENSILEPMKHPLESLPIPIDKNLLGGFAFNVLFKNPTLKVNTKRHLELLKNSGDIPRLVKSLNKIQSTPYEINQKILDVAWFIYSNEVDFPSIPVKPSPLRYPKNKDKLKEYYDKRKQNSSSTGKRISIARTLMLSKKFKDKFYFPVFLDSRGRVYYSSDYLNPQGADLSKALLNFHEGNTIDDDSEFWYYCHIANTYGLDKKSYQERYDWVLTNKKLISSIASNPIANIKLWKNTDSPFQFLAACFDVVEYWKDKKNYKSKLRMSFDATASGLQILSLLLQDKDGCVRTNVLSDCSQSPYDVYLECVEVLLDIIKKDAESGLETVSEQAVFWLEQFKGKSLRSLVKIILMTQVYSLSRYGLNTYVKDWIRENSIKNSSTQLKYLQNRVNEAVNETVKGAERGMLYIKELVNILAQSNKDLEWLLPNGFYMISSYRTPKSKVVNSKIEGKVYWSSYLLDEDEASIKKSKTINASVPNVIHAIDSCILFFIMEKCDFDISVVHDCIFFKACNANKVYEAIREAYKELFELDLLEHLKDFLENKYNIPLPKPPKINKIDYSQILDSDYIWN